MNKSLRVLAILVILTLVLRCQSGEPQPAQHLLIRGTVTDSVLGTPVGAYVMLVGTKQGVLASNAGEFELRVQKPERSPTLLVRSIGYEPKRIPVLWGVDSLVNVGRILLRQALVPLDDLIVDTPRSPSRR